MLRLVDDGVPTGALPVDQLLAGLASLRAMRAAIDAAEQEHLAAVARRDVSDKRWVADEVACVLRSAPVTAQARLEDARALCEQFPATLAALRSGLIGFRHAKVITESARLLAPEVRRAVEAESLAKVGERTVTQFAPIVRRIVARLDARRVEERYAAAIKDRRVVRTPNDDGTSEIWVGCLPADDSARIMRGSMRWPAGGAVTPARRISGGLMR